jgi:hypothetical protein
MNFIAEYRTKNLVCMILTLIEIPPREINVWIIFHGLQLVNILSSFIKYVFCRIMPTIVNEDIYGNVWGGIIIFIFFHINKFFSLKLLNFMMPFLLPSILITFKYFPVVSCKVFFNYKNIF